MFSTEKHFLLQILRDFIHGNASAPADGISWDVVADYARKHQIEAIVYYQTKNTNLHQKYLHAITAYTQRKALLAQIAEAFADIPFYTVKGISVAQYYPVPQLRTMGDCDILVHECDKEKAKEILLANGFAFTDEVINMECHFQKQGLDFELHHRLLYDEVFNTEQEKAFADTAWDHVCEHELDKEFHFVYLLLHLKKHLLDSGVGIRQFLDLAAMSKNADLDKEKIASFLNQAGINRFAGVCSALCARWFQTPLPVDTPEISDDFYAYATEKILSNGVFGKTALSEEEYFVQGVRKNGRLHMIKEHLFPSYKSCCQIPKYQWIKGKPYLLPALWIYRFFWALFSGKTKSSADYIASVAGSGKALTELNEELSMWGL